MPKIFTIVFTSLQIKSNYSCLKIDFVAGVETDVQHDVFLFPRLKLSKTINTFAGFRNGFLRVFRLLPDK